MVAGLNFLSNFRLPFRRLQIADPQKPENGIFLPDQATETQPSDNTDSTPIGIDLLDTLNIGFVTQPSSAYEISKIGRHFVSALMPIQPHDMSVWEEKIKGRLDHVLRYAPGTCDDNESSLALEFLMAGKCDNLKPTILITCCSQHRRRKLKKILRDLDWLIYPYIVIVDGGFGYRAPGFQLGATGARINDIEARLAINPSTLCGSPARIVPKPLHPSNRLQTGLTIGGLVRVHGSLYGLTVAHSFSAAARNPNQPICGREDSDSSGVEYLSSEDDDDDDFSLDSPFALFSPNLSENSDLSDSSSTDEDGPSPSHVRPSSRTNQPKDNRILGYKARTPQQGVDPIHPSFRHLGGVTHNSWASKGSRNSDWALVKIDDETLHLPNTIQLPGEPTPTAIEGKILEADLLPGQVWVAAGVSGLQSGTLSACSVSIQLGDQTFAARQITLPHPPAHGDSGSWVIRDGKVCGHIIAGRGIVPWAYMVPIDHVLQDIGEHLGTDDVSISTDLKQQTGQRSLTQQFKTGIHMVFKSSHAPQDFKSRCTSNRVPTLPGSNGPPWSKVAELYTDRILETLLPNTAVQFAQTNNFYTSAYVQTPSFCHIAALISNKKYRYRRLKGLLGRTPKSTLPGVSPSNQLLLPMGQQTALEEAPAIINVSEQSRKAKVISGRFHLFYKSNNGQIRQAVVAQSAARKDV